MTTPKPNLTQETKVPVYQCKECCCKLLVEDMNCTVSEYSNGRLGVVFSCPNCGNQTFKKLLK